MYVGLISTNNLSRSKMTQILLAKKDCEKCWSARRLRHVFGTFLAKWKKVHAWWDFELSNLKKKGIITTPQIWCTLTYTYMTYMYMYILVMPTRLDASPWQDRWYGAKLKSRLAHLADPKLVTRHYHYFPSFKANHSKATSTKIPLKWLEIQQLVQQHVHEQCTCIQDSLHILRGHTF